MKRFLLFFLILCFACKKEPAKIVVGSKNFTEQLILGEIFAQQIENTLHTPVQRKLNLGGSFICHKAILDGAIDLYVEYTGTAFTGILKEEPIADAGKVYDEVKQIYRKKFNLEWSEPLGFNNAFAMIIRGQDARQLGLKTISQAANYTPKWKAGFGYEFLERKDGYPGLARIYGLKFARPPLAMDLSLTYKAVAEKQVDLIAGDTTNGLIDKLDLFILEDDKHYFPPYEAAAVVRPQLLKDHPELRAAFHRLGNSIPAEKMRQMNYQAEVERKDAKSIAADFLKTLNSKK
jgi:glycine betaine/choline ABC-type transport system substrate-binding protein